MAHKTNITSWNAGGFLAKAVCAVLLGSVVMLGASGTSEADSTVSYYAIYCSQDNSQLSLSSSQQSDLQCSGSGSSPGIEARVATASTDPKGTHDVTIVQADCYPDSPTASVSPSISNNSISCGEGPDATLTLGRHYLAAKKPTPPPGKGKAPTPSAGLAAIDGSSLPHAAADQNKLTTIISVALGIIGAFALLMVAISGLRYVLSGGNPEKTAKARNTLIYSLVGLAVAIAAEAIVTFVVKRL